MLRTTTKFAGLGLAAAGVMTLAACSSDSTDDMDAMDTMEPTTEEAMDETMAPETSESDEMAMDAYANLVGPACMDYDSTVPDGPGSVQGMSQDPVAVAASNNPLLTTLTSAVSGGLNPDVNLVDTLNGDEFTVFAPVDDAFAAIDEDTIAALQTDAELLTSILTYHVVPGQIEPADIGGELTTVNGATLTVSGSGDAIMVNGDVAVLCGGVQTANATVYLIDTVLLPPAE